MERDPTIARLAAEAQELSPQLVAWRRDFHRHPELGFQEVRTGGIVADHLRSLGLEVHTGVGKTGVVALVEPSQGGEALPTVMLRFDMDALPIQEENDVPYRSTVPGVMHACGHDGHTAIGMGVATLLARHRERLPGRVKLVFQPAEEGLGGARAMIRDGVLEAPRPLAAFGLHLWSRLPLNQVVVQAGPLWAAADQLEIVVQGKGGHGATPHETVDATLVASHLVVALQSIVSRNVDPAEAVVISIGAFHAGTAGNVIAEVAELKGTVRTFEERVRAQVQRRIQEMVQGICQSFGARHTVRYTQGVPATVNSPEGARLMERVAQEVVGPEGIARIRPMTVGEDMAEFLQRVGGCLILVGASDPEQGWHSPHHSPTFDFDERMLPTGVALLAGAAWRFLEERHSQGNRSP